MLIETSADGVSFDNVGTFGVPDNLGILGNGASDVRFTRLFSRYWIDGVEYTEICLPSDHSDALASYGDVGINLFPGLK